MDYIIQPGDTLFSIARRFGVSVEQLLAANPQITNPALIIPGQHITVPGPAPQVYIIQPGDTLSAIARRFGITVEQLLAANPQITDPNRIFPGERISIPGAQPQPGTVSYTIQPGDTLFLIARRLGTTVDILLRLNPGIDPNHLIPGQQIRVPAPAAVLPPGCIVYVSTRSGRPELWRSNAAGQGAVQITRESGTVAQPVANPRWSPDGRHLAYQAVGGLFIIDPCGRSPILLTANVANYSWSHDSSRIAFSNTEGTFITDLKGNTSKVISGFNNPVWFPDDQRLAGSLPETEEIRFPHLATVAITGANFTPVDTIPGRIVKLSPDGRYAATEVFSGSAFLVISSVLIYDFNTQTRVDLPGFEVEVRPGIINNASFLGGWAPDSSRLAYSTIISQNGLGEIRIANPQGTIVQRFTRTYYPIPDWGPAPDWVIYTVSENPGTTVFDITPPRDIYVRNLRTNQEILIAGPADEYSPDWNGTACPPC